MLATILFALLAQTPAQTPADKPPLTLNAPELRIGIDDFRKLYEKGEVLVLDVRSAEAYRAGHIPGALSVPLDAVDGKIAELGNERRPIVTYCSWPAEHTSASVALTLRLKGIQTVRALLGGTTAWVRSGGELRKGSKP